MPAPTVAVTVNISAMGGLAIAGVVVSAKLDINDIYQGFVISKEVTGTTNASGVAVLNCFPNASPPDGLGTQGSTYRFQASIPGGKKIDVQARVPNVACNLHEIVVDPGGVVTGVSGFSHAVTYAAGTVGAKLRDSVNVKDAPYNADPTGVASASAAFTSAGAASASVVAPAGTFSLPTTPTITLLELYPATVLTGAGASGLGFTANAKRQTLHNNTAGTDFATRYIRRNATHTGGAPGFVASGLRVDVYVSAGVANYEWAITGVVNNSATGGENCGGYFLANKMTATTGATIGAVMDLDEVVPINNPTTSSVGAEIDVRCNGTDSLNSRVGLDVYIGRYAAAGAVAEVGHGVRIQNNGDAAGVNVKTGYGFQAGVQTQVAFDASAATVAIAAFKLAANQNIAFDAAASNLFGNDTAGLAYSVAGVKKSRLLADGSIELFGLRTKIAGTFSTGATAPVLSANKPGTSTAIATWFDITIDGTAFVIPAWSKA